ncbi:MAG TPA: hypothetical protein PLL02_05245 [Bacteroidales bacterium]|nr:hypothetical protein [Bacteroidales bacterium]
MLKLACSIHITCKNNAKITLDYCNSITVKTSTKNLTDTASVSIPRNISRQGKFLTDYINRGDKIELRFGYEEYGVNTMFKGYIKDIVNDFSVKIECENEMYMFKKTNVVPKVYESFDLKSFLKEYVQDIEVEYVGEAPAFGKFTVANEMTLSEALDKIMEAFPYIKGYFQGGKFICQLASVASIARETIHVDPNRNIISDTLKYIKEDDVKIGVKAIHIRDDNSRLVAYSPSKAFAEAKGNADRVVQKGYELRTQYCTTAKDMASLQEWADERAKMLTQERMDGSITMFGVPLVWKGDNVTFNDDYRKERTGKRFFVESVDYNFSNNGFNQTVTLGFRML